MFAKTMLAYHMIVQLAAFQLAAYSSQQAMVMRLRGFRGLRIVLPEILPYFKDSYLLEKFDRFRGFGYVAGCMVRVLTPSANSCWGTRSPQGAPQGKRTLPCQCREHQIDADVSG